jgi:hypothetical protein
MLDLLVLWFLARHAGRVAEQRGHTRGRGVVRVVVPYLGCEIGGAVLGLIAGGETTMILGAFAGLLLGLILGLVLLGMLPNLGPEETMAVIGPSLGDQIVGSTCPECAVSFMTKREATTCSACKVYVHPGCLKKHRRHQHSKAARPREMEGAH